MKRLFLFFLAFALSFSALLPNKVVYADATVSQSSRDVSEILASDYQTAAIEYFTSDAPIRDAIYGRTITSVGFQLWKTGSPTGNVDIKIIKWNGLGSGSSGVVLWSTTQSASALTGTPTWYDYNVPGGLFASLETTANISIGVWYGNTASATGAVYTGAYKTSDIYPSYGSNAYWYSGIWSYQDIGANNAQDLTFRYSYGGGSSASIQTLGADTVGTVSATLHGIWDSAGSTNASVLGFQVGTSSGSYTSNITASVNYASIGYNLEATGLSASTIYYYRAEGYNGAWYYGLEKTFLTSATPSVETLYATNINSTYATLVAIVADLNNSGNYTDRGFVWGTANGTWSGSNIEHGNWNGASIGTGGLFTKLATGLQPATTYYFMPLVANQYGTTLGEVKTFQTLSVANQTFPPNVSAISATQVGEDTNTGLLNLAFTGQVNASDTNLFAVGFDYAVVDEVVVPNMLGGIQYQIGSWNGTYDNRIQKLTSSQSLLSVGQFTLSTGYTVTQGAKVYYRAWASNSAGVGYSTDNLSYQTGSSSVTLTVTADKAVVDGNTAGLYGKVTFDWQHYFSKPDSVMFSWGTNADGDQYFSPTIQLNQTSTGFYYKVTGLATLTDYNFRAGVIYHGEATWSAPLGFTTGNVSLAVIGVPNVRTNAALSATSTSFVASGTIIDINSGNANEIGFYVGYDSRGNDFVKHVTGSGTFGPSSFNGTVSKLATNSIVYYRAYAINTIGESQANIVGVQLAPYGTIPPTAIAPKSELDFGASMRKIAAQQGLDNTTGHWAFLLEIELVIALLFGIALLSATGMAKTAIAVAWVLASIACLGAFLFSGLLGIMAVIVASAMVVIVVIIVLGAMFGKGGTPNA